MREVNTARTVQAPLSAVESTLTPETIVEYEGRFTPKDVTESDGRTVVTAWPSGRLLAPRFVFERRPDGLVYHQDDDGRPPVRVETTVRLSEGDAATDVSVRSTVRSTLPVPPLGRYAAWRRRRTLDGLLDRLEADLR